MKKTLSRLLFLAGTLAVTLSASLIPPAHAITTPTCQSLEFTSCSLNGSKRTCVDATTGKTGTCFCLDHVYDCAF